MIKLIDLLRENIEDKSKIEAGVGLLLKLDNTTKSQIESIITKMPSEPNGSKMTKLPDDKLHITLTSIKAFKPFKDKFKNLDDTKIPNVELGDAAFVYRDDGKVTYVVGIKNQSEIKDFVDNLYKMVGETNPEPDRFFHITLCNNQGGDPFKSIGNVEKSDLIKEDIKTSLQFFFDLDGVLADMEKGLQQNPKIVSLRKRLDDLIKNEYPQYKNLVDDEIKEKLKTELPPDAPKDHPLRPLKRAFNDYRNSVFGVAAEEGFYKNLPLMPGTKEMLEAAQKISGKKPHILSSPVQGDNTSVQEKIDWVETNFKGLVDKIIIDTNKGKYAKSKNDVLIDDRPKYITEFESAGGSAILHKNYNTTIKEMEKFKQNEHTIRLIDLLNEGLFDFFPKKEKPTPTPPPTSPKSQGKEKAEYQYNGKPVTIEGINAKGSGYSVWKGNNPIGDMRQEANKQIKNVYGDKDNKRYYMVIGLQDHVGRPAYFTISTPKDNGATDEELKEIADKILKLNPDKKIKTLPI